MGIGEGSTRPVGLEELVAQLDRSYAVERTNETWNIQACRISPVLVVVELCMRKPSGEIAGVRAHPYPLTPTRLAPFSDYLAFRARPSKTPALKSSAIELHHTAPVTMDRLLRLLPCLLLLLLLTAPLAAALKFDLHAVQAHDAAKYERCIRNFVAKDQLVVVTAILDGYRGDGQTVNMHVRGRPWGD